MINKLYQLKYYFETFAQKILFSTYFKTPVFVLSFVYCVAFKLFFSYLKTIDKFVLFLFVKYNNISSNRQI